MGDACERQEIDRLVHHKCLYLNEASFSWILNHMDYFVSQSRALESLQLDFSREDMLTLAHPESLTKLLRVPSLRSVCLSVCFSQFYVTSPLWQATANALMEGTAVTNLEFRNFSFTAEENATILASGLSRNTSGISIKVVSTFDPVLYSALATALPANSTLRELSFVVDPRGWADYGPIDQDWSSIFSALGQNTGLKTLTVDFSCSMDESLCTAMQNGLGMNNTLESLERVRQ
jgi:hypothetical protein